MNDMSAIREALTPEYHRGYQDGFNAALQSQIDAAQKSASPPSTVITAPTAATSDLDEVAREIVRDTRFINDDLVGRISAALKAERERIAKIQFAKVLEKNGNFPVAVDGWNIELFSKKEEAEEYASTLNELILRAIRQGSTE